MDYDFNAYQAMYLFSLKDFISKYSPEQFAIILTQEPNQNLVYFQRLKIMMLDFSDLEAYEYASIIKHFLEANHQDPIKEIMP
jgi:hypothetical protein